MSKKFAWHKNCFTEADKVSGSHYLKGKDIVRFSVNRIRRIKRQQDYLNLCQKIVKLADNGEVDMVTNLVN